MSHINTNVNNLNYLNPQDTSTADGADETQTSQAAAATQLGGVQRTANVDTIAGATPSGGGATSILSTRPPTLSSNMGVNQADLASGTSRMGAITQGFVHPVNGAMILAMEEGTHNLGGTETTLVQPRSRDHKKTSDSSPAQKPVVRATAGAAAGAATGAGAASSDDSTTQSDPSASTSDTSSDTSGAGSTSSSSGATTPEGLKKLFEDQDKAKAANPAPSSSSTNSDGYLSMNQVVNVQTATLDANNPNSKDAQALLDSASEAPHTGTGSKCKNDSIEKTKAQDIAKATGIPEHQAMTLLRAMDSNPKGGRNDHDQTAPGEDTTIALSLATLTKLKASGGNPEAQNKLRDQLTNAANNIAASATSGGKGMTLDQSQSYGKSISNLTSYCQQLAVDSGKQALDDASQTSKQNLVATKLV